MITEWSLREWRKGGKFQPELITKKYYIDKISRLATSQFEYNVKDVKTELIEKWLWTDGKVAIWKSKTFGWVVTRCYETAWGIDGLPIKWKPVFEYSNGLEQPKEMGLDDDIVVIYDTLLHIPTNICCKWIDEIADVNETIRTQIFNQKTPLIALAKNPRDKEKLKNAIVDIANNVKALVLDTDIKQDVKALNIDAPFNITDLQAYLKQKETEMLEFLGIDSQSSFQKKERLITDEQESNNQILSYLMIDRYKARVMGCDELRKKGLEITVTMAQTFNPNGGDENDKTDSEIDGMETDKGR